MSAIISNFIIGFPLIICIFFVLFSLWCSLEYRGCPKKRTDKIEGNVGRTYFRTTWTLWNWDNFGHFRQVWTQKSVFLIIALQFLVVTFLGHPRVIPIITDNGVCSWSLCCQVLPIDMLVEILIPNQRLCRIPNWSPAIPKLKMAVEWQRQN